MMRRSISSHSVKHTPQRTCVACCQIKTKRELIRLVRIADGSVEIDIGGKKAGRGAYLCRVQECWEAGLKSGRLEHTLRTTLTQHNREQLIEAARKLHFFNSGMRSDGEDFVGKSDRTSSTHGIWSKAAIRSR